MKLSTELNIKLLHKKWSQYFFGLIQLRHVISSDEARKIFEYYFSEKLKKQYCNNFKIWSIKYHLITKKEITYLELQAAGAKLIDKTIEEINELINKKSIAQLKKISDAIHNLPNSIIQNKINTEHFGLVNLDNYLKEFPSEKILELWEAVKRTGKLEKLRIQET